MSDIILNIYGGTLQVNPNATSAVQNFYGDQFAAEKIREGVLNGLDLSPEAGKFAIYINKVEELPRYLSLLSACTSAAELAQVVMTLMKNEEKITKEEVVKERFIEKLLPLAPHVTKGTSVDNIRQRINDALAKLPKKRT